MFDTEDFIIAVFCCIDDFLKEITQGRPLRKRGFAPSLTDSEVITMEIVGEFRGLDTDRDILVVFPRPLVEIISPSQVPFHFCSPSCQSLEL